MCASAESFGPWEALAVKLPDFHGYAFFGWVHPFVDVNEACNALKNAKGRALVNGSAVIVLGTKIILPHIVNSSCHTNRVRLSAKTQTIRSLT